MNNLERIDPATASLPTNYEAACTALAECVRVDECQEWADKMAALASYARQREDKTLENHCRRILARAVRREGEILLEIEPATGARTDLEPSEGDHTKLTRKQVARDAGLSDHQRVTALRVANVPADKFEAAVESDDPPSVTALAERGRNSRPEPLVDLAGRSPEDFAEATKLIGLVTRFLVDTEKLDVAAARRGFSAEERTEFYTRARRAAAWLTALAPKSPAVSASRRRLNAIVETLDDVGRMLADARDCITALPHDESAAFAWSCLNALGIGLIELIELAVGLPLDDDLDNGSVIDAHDRSVVVEAEIDHAAE